MLINIRNLQLHCNVCSSTHTVRDVVMAVADISVFMLTNVCKIVVVVVVAAIHFTIHNSNIITLPVTTSQIENSTFKLLLTFTIQMIQYHQLCYIYKIYHEMCHNM